MNYIYFKELPKLTQVGTHKDTGEPLYFTTWPLVPMLIIDAPDRPNQSNKVLDTPEWTEHLRKTEDVALLAFNTVISLSEKIPFHSNEQVFEWLKSKGITQEPDGLYEFDGEYKIKYILINRVESGNITETIVDEDVYNASILEKKKVAIIKPTIQEETCPTCGSKVKIEGHTTKYYVPLNKEEKDNVRNAAEKSWDEINGQHPEGVNPYAFVIGFKEGYKYFKDNTS